MSEPDETEDGEDEHAPVDVTLTLEVLELKRHRHMHVHRCRHVAVEVNFSGRTKRRKFSPAATIGVVTQWARKKFQLDPAAAAEYVLQLCSSTEQPRPDEHLGELVEPPKCSICFDLVKESHAAGMMRMEKPDQRLFEDDLSSAEFRTGVVKGYWGLAGSRCAAGSTGMAERGFSGWRRRPAPNAPDRFYISLDARRLQDRPSNRHVLGPDHKGHARILQTPKGQARQPLCKGIQDGLGKRHSFLPSLRPRGGQRPPGMAEGAAPSHLDQRPHHRGLSGGIPFLAELRRLHWRLTLLSPPSASLSCFGPDHFPIAAPGQGQSAKAERSCWAGRTVLPAE